MIAFPRHGLRIRKTGDIITISMTNDPNDSDFKYYTHSRGSTLKDKFYIGAYLGITTEETVNGETVTKLRSLSGKTIITNTTLTQFRLLARANTPASNGNGGSGYDQLAFYPLTYLQAMYCLKYKNLNSQSAVGMGWVSHDAATNTGGTNLKGMNWGETAGKEQMKLFGIEDL